MQRISNIRSLQASIESGAHPDYLFFWGHTPRHPNAVDRSCLSQWYPASFTVDGNEYVTAEHYMMAEKARLFGDLELAERIIRIETPTQAKQLGREVGDFDQQRWEEARCEIVFAANLAKFEQNLGCRAFLLASHDRVLVEASPVDNIWGIGLAMDDPRAESPGEWLGLNLLGFALMRVRERLHDLQQSGVAALDAERSDMPT